MNPLLFLTYRTFFNGVKRALSSPTRLIGLLFFLMYYFMWFVRPYMASDRGLSRAMSGPLEGRFEFPPLTVVDAVVFGAFAVLSLLMMLGGLAQQGAFKPADVDVLFPTPISPRLVLAFRMIRDYLLTLIVPFIFMLIGFVPVRAGWEWLFKNIPHPESAGLFLRAGFTAWLLVAMCWVTLNYAISLFVNRSDAASERNKRILAWTMVGIVLGAGASIAFQVREMQSLSDLVGIAQSPLLRTVFFTATFATHLTMAPLTGSWGFAVYGIGSMLALVAGALMLAMSQAGWMYDQAAVKGFGNLKLRSAQRMGDSLAAAAEIAANRKGGYRKLAFLYRWQAAGPWALVWKDLFLQARGLFGMLVMLVLAGVAMIALPALVPGKRAESPGAMFLLMQAVAIFSVTISLANMGYLELLRRIDLQKPLPFRPSTIVFFEVGAKAVLGIGVSFLGSLVAVALKPSLAMHALAATLFAPAFSVLLCAGVFLVIILFPDMEDQTQRQFRGMLLLIALAVLGLPPIGLALGLAFVGVPMALAGLIGGLACLGIAVLVAAASGNLYANFNPSE